MEYTLIKKQIEVPVIRRITMRIVAIVAAIFDIFFLVLLGLDRLPLLFWAGPAALFLVDAAFIIESFFANYRVRYARLTFRLVATLGVVAFTFTGLMLYMGSSTMVTYWSMGVFLLERLVVGLFSFHCYKAARKPGKGNVLSVFPALAMTAAAAASGFFFFSNGALGQGRPIGENKTLTYEYNNGLAGYVVNGYVNGRGNIIDVPAMFNNAPVVGINSDVLVDQNISAIIIENRVGDFQVVDGECRVWIDAFMYESSPNPYVEGNKYPVLYCNKYIFDSVKEPMLDKFVSTKDEKWLYFANNMVPTDLKDDEVYVSFKYSKDVAEVVNGEYVDTWIGKKRSMYEPEKENTPFYITARDHSNGDDLQRCYEKYKGILKPFIDKTGADIFEENVTMSTFVSVEFEPVYKFNIKDGNDTKFQYAENFVSNTGNDSYYYSTIKGVDSMFGALPEREGFTVSYTYSLDTSTTEKAIEGKLSDVVKGLDAKKTININPTFTMNTPDFSIDVGTGETAFTCQYGDNIHLIAKEAVSDVPNHSFDYKWYKNGILVDVEANHSIQNMQPEHAGEYSCLVTVSSPESSLTASIQKEQVLSYTKRKLDIVWSGNLENTYDGTDFRPTPSVSNTENIVNGDVVVPEITSTSPLTAVNAGTYLFAAEMPSSLSSYYEIRNGGSTSRLVNKRGIQIVWNTFNSAYNGQVQLPTVQSITNKVVGESNTSILNNPTSDRTSVNAGTYNATVTVKSQNYVITGNETYQYTIDKRVITGVWGDVDLTYNGTLQSAQYISFTDVVAGEESLVLGSVVYTGTQKNVGTTYSVTASLPASSNYTIATSSKSTSFSIAALELSNYQWSSDSLTFNGRTDNYPTLTNATNLLEADKDTFTASLIPTGDGNRNVGSHTVTYTIPSNSNYVFQGGVLTASKTYQITQRNVTLTWNTGSFDYNGLAHNPVVNGISGIQEGDTESAIIAGLVYTGDLDEVEADESGSLMVTASLPVGSNYKITANASKTYVINRKNITLNWSASTFTYDGTAHCPTIVSVSGAASGDELSLVADILVTGDATAAGSYNASAAITSMNNYKISAPTKSFTINERTVTIDWTTSSLTYNRNSQMPGYTLNNVVVGEETSFAASLTFTGRGINVGNYTISVSTSNANYTIGTGKTHPYSILPYEITVSWASSSVIYDGTTKAPTYTIEGVLAGDTVTLTLSNRGKNVGNYTVLAESANSNYVVSSGSSKDYTILAREIAIDWSSSQVTYNGTDQAPAFTLDNVVSGEDALYRSSLTYTGRGKNVGNYTVNVTSSNTNYTIISGASKSYEIVAREVTLNWSAAGLTYNGSEQMPTFTLTNVVSGEETSFRAGLSYAGRGTDAGTYTVTVTNSNSNYTIASGASKSYGINPRQVSIVWSNGTLTYNGSEQMPTYNANNVVSGEEASFRAGLVFTGKGVNSGSHTVTVSNTNGNYEIASGATKTYTIGKYGVTITWENPSFTYDGNEHAPSYTVGAVVSGEESLFESSLTVSGAAINAGSHTMTIATSNPNYSIASGSTKTYSIAKRGVTITWNDDTFTYNGTAQMPTYTYSNVVSGEESLFESSLSFSGVGVNAGSHTVVASTSNANYTISTGASKTYVIGQAHISLVWSSETSFEEDGATHNPTVTGVTGDVASGDLSGLIASIQYTGASREAGSHTVTATLTGEYATNYVIDSGASCAYEITAVEVPTPEPEPAIFFKMSEYVMEVR